MNRSAAEIVREYGPFPGVTRVNGVTYDGQQVWIAVEDKLNAFDPVSGKVLRSIDARPLALLRGSPGLTVSSGTVPGKMTSAI